jgi:HSP20 family protein
MSLQLARVTLESIQEGGESMPVLEKWAPLPDLDIVERRMRRLFEDVGIAPSITPAADVYETGDEIVVELEVPGYDESNLAVTISDHTLAVTGTREEDKEKEERALRVRERLESHFERRFQLPTETDSAHVRAEYGKGVLTLHVPKLAELKPRIVTIDKKK